MLDEQKTKILWSSQVNWKQHPFDMHNWSLHQSPFCCLRLTTFINFIHNITCCQSDGSVSSDTHFSTSVTLCLVLPASLLLCTYWNFFSLLNPVLFLIPRNEVHGLHFPHLRRKAWRARAINSISRMVACPLWIQLSCHSLREVPMEGIFLPTTQNQ
jgi:hypothetical protein